ncbi:MAG: NAD(P)H-dependent oxidoreductase [Cyanobacteria bacterium P01_G01_bin.54]
MTPETVLKQLNWRYAVKAFDPERKIPADVWQALEESMVLAPSSFGLQPWKFFVVDNPELRAQLLPHSWGQKQVVDASHLVVFAIKIGVNAEDVDRYIARMSEVQGTPIENLAGFGKMIKGFLENPPFPFEVDDWSTRQVYIALSQFMVAAAMLEVDTCPMEGFMPDEYDKVLGLKDQGYHAVVVCPTGYRAADDKYATRPKVRFTKTDMVAHI